MVKKALGLILAALMLVPAASFAAPTTEDLARQIQLLTEQLSVLQEQLNEVRETSDDNADVVELLESKAAKWDNNDRISFSGDYRFRADYSDADTKAYWAADSIADATSNMIQGQGFNLSALNANPTLTTAEKSAMMTTAVQGAVSMMQGVSAADRKFMIENFNALATAGFPQTPAAIGAALGAWDVSTMGPIGYEMAAKDSYKNDLLYTNRFRLGVNAKVSENVTFKGRLAMYKAWGMQSNPTTAGPYTMNSFSEMDGATTRQPDDSVLRVDRGYINWTNVFDLPIWFSVGRRPTTDGPPANLRMGRDERMATPVNFMDYAFDGISLGYRFKNIFSDELGYSKLRFCYGRGFEAGPLDNANNLDDMDFGGLSWDVIDQGHQFLNVQSFLAANIVNVPDGVTFYNPLELAIDPDHTISNGTLDTENLGNIYHTSFVYMNKFADLNYFLSGGWSHTDPDGVDEMGSTLLGSWWEDPGEKDGYCVYAGVRYDLDDLGLKFGLEYNYGTKYWISMTPGHDDMTQSKLATRGHVGEVYMIWDLPVGELLSDKCAAFMRLGFQHYEYDYTGSGNWLGAPVDVDDLDDPLNAQFWAPIDRMDQAYLTIEAWF
ncbi:MAG: DUF3373 family protein [Desulfuromonadaceae bacterium]|nr:DUF3373 family protein [Desulfuromonadaceae bacterium]